MVGQAGRQGRQAGRGRGQEDRQAGRQAGRKNKVAGAPAGWMGTGRARAGGDGRWRNWCAVLFHCSSGSGGSKGGT